MAKKIMSLLTHNGQLDLWYRTFGQTHIASLKPKHPQVLCVSKRPEIWLFEYMFEYCLIYIWAYLGIFGHIWVYLGIFGHKLLCLGRTISHWESIACPMSDSFRFCLNHRPWRPGWSFKHVWNLLGVLICFQKNDIRLINGWIRSLELGFTLWQFNIAMENGHL